MQRTAQHASGTRYAHLGSALADLPTIRNYIARMRIKTDMARTLLDDTILALEDGRADAMLRVLSCKAAAGEAAIEVVDTAMRVCGGAAFRKDVGVERYFRDARAAGVMGPTTDVLYDFIGKAVCGHAAVLRTASMTSPSQGNATDFILGAVAYDPKVVTIWDGFQQYFRPAACRSTTCCSRTTSARSRRISAARPRRLELAAGVAAGRACRRPSRPAGARRSACATPIAIS